MGWETSRFRLQGGVGVSHGSYIEFNPEDTTGAYGGGQGIGIYGYRSGNPHTELGTDKNGITVNNRGIVTIDTTANQATTKLIVGGGITASGPITGGTITGTTITGTNFAGVTKGMVALGNVDDTSDLEKPVSTKTTAFVTTSISNIKISNIIDIEPYSYTNKKKSILYKSSVSIYDTDIIPEIDYTTDIVENEQITTFGASKKGLWVAVGTGDNSIAYSRDGINWTGRGNSIFTNGKGVVWNGKMWVASGGGNNTIAYSYDGITWTGLGKTIIENSGNGVAWNGKMWVAVGGGTNNTIAYSYDGINWTGLGKNIMTTRGRGVAWNGEMWVAGGAGDNTIAYSYDGITWYASVNGNTILTGCRNVVWNGTIFVAVGEGADTIAYSSDGINWAGSSSGTAIIKTICYGVAWNGKMWVAGGQGTNTIAYSYDGITWYPSSNGNTIFTIGYRIAWNGTMWVAGGEGTNTIAYSRDGITWTGSSNGNTILTTGCYDVAWNGARENQIIYPSHKAQTIVSVGGNTSTWFRSPLSVSTDGGNTWTESWSAQSVFSPSHDWSADMNNIEYGGGVWVATNARNVAGNKMNQIGYSYDGNTWYGLGYALFYTSIFSLKYGNGMWLMGGSGTQGSIYGTNRYLAYSYDGITWTPKLYASGDVLNESVNALGWNGQIWLAGGKFTNKMAYSYNGIDWFEVGTNADDSTISSVMSDILTIVWNGFIWVAGGSPTTVTGSSKTIGYSYNGIDNWTWIDCKLNTICRDVAWNGSRWVATGKHVNVDSDPNIITASIAYSDDVITWYNPTEEASGAPFFKERTMNGVYSSPPSNIFEGGNTVFWSGTKWFVGGNDGDTDHSTAVPDIYNTLVSSDDGIDWTWSTTTTNGHLYRQSTHGIASNRGVYPAQIKIQQPTIAVGEGTNHSIAYSPDGITWTGRGGRHIFTKGKGVVWNGKIWVAVGRGTKHTIATSPDGIYWTGQGNTIFSTEGNGVVWNGTIFVAVGEGINTIAFSVDGINWTGSNSGNSILSLGNAVTWNGSIFLAVGSGSSHSIAFSVDGITWNGRGGNVITVCKGVVWAGNLWVVVGEGINNIYGSTYTNNWYKIGETYEDKRTVNGVEVITYPLRLYQYDPNSNNNAVTVLFNGCNGVAWNGTRVVAVGDGNTNIGSGSPATGNYNTIAYVDGFHRLAGEATTVYPIWTGSSNGNNIFDRCFGVSWNGERWVAVGEKSNNNVMAYSYDGDIWFESPSIGDNIFTTGYGVAGNPKIGAPIVPSKLVLDNNYGTNNYGTNNYGTNNYGTNKLDVVTDSYNNINNNDSENITILINASEN